MLNFNSLFRESLHVYLDEKSLKIVKVKIISGKMQIDGGYYKKIEGMIPADVVQQIRDGLASLNTGVRNLTVVLPSKYAISKNIEVPSLDSTEIEDIIRLQAVRHTPYSKEEVIVGHINLEQILERYTKVLLVIVSNENVHKKTDLLELAGYNVEAVHLSADVLVRLVHELRPFVAAESPYGLVSIEADFADFIIVHNAKPHFIRSVPAGFEHLKKDPESVVKQLTEEFKKTCEAYQTEDQGPAIKRFLVAGQAGQEQALLLKSIRENFQTEAEALSLEGKLSFTPSGKEAFDALGSVPFLDVLADSSIQDASAVDLLPADLKLRKSFREKSHEIFTAAIFAIIIVALFVGVFLTKIYFRSDYLNQIGKKFQSEQKEAERLDAISEETRLVRDFQRKRNIAIRVLNEFQRVLPQEMYLSEISLTSDGHVSIKGTSKLMSTVFSFVTELENSPHFKGVTSDYTKSRKENDQDVSDFGLSALLEDTPDHGR